MQKKIAHAPVRPPYPTRAPLGLTTPRKYPVYIGFTLFIFI